MRLDEHAGIIRLGEVKREQRILVGKSVLRHRLGNIYTDMG
jgi:hypothetical protein